MAEYTLTKAVGSFIQKERADAMMQRYRDKHPEKEAIIARFIGSDKINELLAQGSCVGLRVYFGYDDKGALEVFFVGAKADGTNIGPIGKGGAPAGLLLDNTMACPPYCP